MNLGSNAAVPVRRTLRLLQTSDVHLGPASVEPTGRHHEKECVCPIDVISHFVEEHDVDVVLLVGDLFDHARVSDQLVVETFARLGRVRAEVALLPGNHDQFDERALYRRHREAIDAAGVRFFDDVNGMAHDLADGALRLWARCMEDHTPQYTPLVGAPAHPGDRWYVVAGHGHFVSSADDLHRSSPITASDIEATQADYVALGHWHVMTDLTAKGVVTPAWYSGAPLFGYGAGQMLLVDLVPGLRPQVQAIAVLEHPAGACNV